MTLKLVYKLYLYVVNHLCRCIVIQVDFSAQTTYKAMALTFSVISHVTSGQI